MNTCKLAALPSIFTLEVTPSDIELYFEHQEGALHSPFHVALRRIPYFQKEEIWFTQDSQVRGFIVKFPELDNACCWEVQEPTTLNVSHLLHPLAAYWPEKVFLDPELRQKVKARCNPERMIVKTADFPQDITSLTECPPPYINGMISHEIP